MINPALEYLSRNADILKLSIPCSFMANGVNGDKKVVAIHAIDSLPALLHVRVWLIEKAEPEMILPPSMTQNIPKESLATPWHFFPEGDNPIGYLAEFPDVKTNRRDRPIPQDMYDRICGNMFFSQSHRENREQFLWTSFEKTFPNLSKLSMIEYPRTHIRHNLDKYSPKLHRYWTMWKTHMLDFQSEIAPELYYWATSVASSSSSAVQSVSQG